MIVEAPKLMIMMHFMVVLEWVCERIKVLSIYLLTWFFFHRMTRRILNLQKSYTTRFNNF